MMISVHICTFEVQNERKCAFYSACYNFITESFQPFYY